MLAEHSIGHASSIRVERLTKRFGGQEILRDVSLEIAAGEVLVVLGPSGSGKTTLLRIIAGLEQPDGGEIHLYGQTAISWPPQKRDLGVVFQEHALFPRKTVEQNIAFGLESRNQSKALIQQTVDDMLRLVGLREHRTKYPSQLSGGQRQRVAIAQQEGSDDIEFDLKESRAYEGSRRNRESEIPLIAAKPKDNRQTLEISFDPPVSPGKTVTIALKPVRNPRYGGVYLFGVTAFPAGEKARSYFLGFGRLHFYESGDWGRYW